MARKMTEWPSKRGPITKIMPSDGCIGDTVPLAVGKWYEFHEFGWYMGNVGLLIFAKIMCRMPGPDVKQRQDGPYSGPSSGGEWYRVRERAGLDDVRLHDLRHSFASRALALGESLSMIGKLLGHTKIQTTARYAHLARDSVKESAARVAASIGADILP